MLCDGETYCKKSGKSEQSLVAHPVALEEDKEDVPQQLNIIKIELTSNHHMTNQMRLTTETPVTTTIHL